MFNVTNFCCCSKSNSTYLLCEDTSMIFSLLQIDIWNHFIFQINIQILKCLVALLLSLYLVKRSQLFIRIVKSNLDLTNRQECQNSQNPLSDFSKMLLTENIELFFKKSVNLNLKFSNLKFEKFPLFWNL